MLNVKMYKSVTVTQLVNKKNANNAIILKMQWKMWEKSTATVNKRNVFNENWYYNDATSENKKRNDK